MGETREETKRMLKEIRNESFAKEWILENRMGRPMSSPLRKKETEHSVQEFGEKLRFVIDWL
jgi:ketol-acid reductoisomerase